MDSFILYLLKVSAGEILLYVSYILFFSNDTFYLRNRFFLLATLLIPFIIPWLNLNNGTPVSILSESSNIVIDLATKGGLIEEAVYNRVNSYNIQILITWIYFSISGIFLFRLVIGVIRTLLIIRKGIKTGNAFPKIVLSSDDHPPFSFFPFIVIPAKIYENSNCSQILSHEKTHVSQGHTFDLLLTEVVIVFLWFNPFVWLARRSVVLNHEFIADSISIRMTQNAKEYQYNLLNLHKSFVNARFTHCFSSLIKNRIIMINKIPTRNYAILKSIIIVPVVAILFAMFSFKPESQVDSIADQSSLFSAASKGSIYRFLNENIVYPKEALENNDTATIFIDIQMKKGGIIKNINTYTEKEGIKAPITDEIVVVAYSRFKQETNAKNASKDHKLLKEECLRIANILPGINVPEWNERDMEFVIPIKFKLNI